MPCPALVLLWFCAEKAPALLLMVLLLAATSPAELRLRPRPPVSCFPAPTALRFSENPVVAEYGTLLVVTYYNVKFFIFFGTWAGRRGNTAVVIVVTNTPIIITTIILIIWSSRNTALKKRDNRSPKQA